MGTDELRSALAPHPEGVLVAVWAVPGASRTGITGLHAGALRIRVAAPPEAGRANEAIAKLLGGRLGVPVRLAGPARSRRKSFLARGLTVDQAADRLAEGR